MNFFTVTSSSFSTSFTQLAPKATEFSEITQHKALRRPRSLRVTDLGTTRKLDHIPLAITNLPVVINRGLLNFNYLLSCTVSEI